MPTVVVVGKRFVPAAHVALIEAFDPQANPKFQPTQDYKSRVVLLNRDSVLALEPLEAFVRDHGFRFLAEDQVAANPAVYFQVERFMPAKDFVPSKPFQTRLRWRDLEGNEQSKLLLAPPEMVLATMTGANIELAGEGAPKSPRRKATARQHRRSQAKTHAPG